jgi:hypothetical protein
MTNNNEKKDHPHRALIEEILQLMNISSMQDDERNMWKIMLPSMPKEEIDKFKTILEKEIKQLAGIYLEAKQKAKLKK